MVFKINFKNLTCIYKCNYFVDLQYIFLNIKKILPLIINTVKKNKNYLFLFNKSFYSQTVLKNNYSTIKESGNIKLGLFTNFSIIIYNATHFLDIKTLPCFLICFFLNENNNLFLESKKQHIPSIGLIYPVLNSTLVDYPIFFNFFYFYSVYFFNKFLLAFMLINK
jgi:hypothetical protein